MTSHRLEKKEWRGFCDRVSLGLAGKRAAIEIASLEVGTHLQARWLPVMGLAYDPTEDVIEILLDGLEHMIFNPRDLYVDYGPGGVESLGIVDHDRGWQIVLLRDPLMLPAPRA